MEHLYIINPETFKGSIINTMPAPYFDETHPNFNAEINSTLVHYSNLTFQQFNKEHENKLIALTWEKFNNDYYLAYLSSLQHKFEEITEQRYYDLLECLPPKKWHDIAPGVNVFFMGECYTENLYICCIHDRKLKKYFSALRSIFAKDDVLLNDYLNNL